MVNVKAKTKFDPRKLRQAAKRANIENLGHAGGAIRLAARRSIKRSPKPSLPGQPPHTRRGLMRNAIRYAVEKDKQSVVIGPDYTIAGPSGVPHEFGGAFRGERYAKRPFMGPALEQVRPRLPRMWAGSVK